MLHAPLAGQISQNLEKLSPILQYRNVGPTRGGRVTAVAGHKEQPGTFYMGATGGGVWKTENYGHDWKNISDGYFATGSIGAISVSPSAPNIIYVGTGSDGIRSNVIIGNGVYKSSDAGKTWQHLGLARAGQIGSIVIDPANPDLVLVAAIGNPFTAHKDRGVFRSQDGGKNWTKTLFISDTTGVVDLEFAPDDPQIIYATAWRVERKPWTIISGGHEGGIYKSVDAGRNWKKLENGLPQGLIGKSDLAVSAQMPNRIWALIEAPAGVGGVYLSDDRGENFKLISTKKELLDRPFYYCNIDANPQNGNSIYVNSTRFWHSVDGGKTWKQKRTPHGDNHDMWINPIDSNLFIQSNDGGAAVTRDGGLTWSSIENQPTAELYQVSVDDQNPFWLYAGQQDNTTISVPSLPPYPAPAGPKSFWMSVGGCETGPAIPKPGNPDIVYSNCKGRFSVYNKKTGQEQHYYVGASNMYGHNPKDLKYRFQRVSPIHISPHDSGVIYHASQYLHKTTDEGRTWITISPDLTAFSPETQVISGEPITRDITGEEFFSTIYAVKESSVRKDLIWVGSNDGLVHITENGGEDWENVTPEDLSPHARIQTIEPSLHDDSIAYIAAYRYLLGDFRPYIFKTEDLGKNWTLLTDGHNGIPVDCPTRVVREDPNQAGLLYAGTEFGMYISFDNGTNWQPFQQNLPVTPITDIQIFRQNLIISTMGRSFWIMDDLNLLYQLGEKALTTTLFAPKAVHRLRYHGTDESEVPYYPSAGLNIGYYLEKEVLDLELKIFDQDGKIVRKYEVDTNTTNEAKSTDMSTGFERIPASENLSGMKGAHILRWNLRHAPIVTVKGRKRRGPMVAPGRYRIELTIGLKSYINHAEVKMDPRVKASGITVADLIAQEKLALKVQKLMSETESLLKFLDQNISENQTAVSKETLRIIHSEIATKEGRYQIPMLKDQLRYLASMLDQADQPPGKDAYLRYEELHSKLTKLQRQADAPGMAK